MRFIGNNCGRILLFAAAICCTAAAEAVVRRAPESSLQKLSTDSDTIVIGKCVDKKAQYMGGIIATEYRVEVTDVLKGPKTAGSMLTLTIPGGDLKDPPLSMHSPVHSSMYAGEKVALFLRNPKPSPALAAGQNPVPGREKLRESMQIVGGYEGKFSVFTDKADGREKITRLRLESFGYVHKDQTLERMLNALATGDIQATSGPAVSLGQGLYTSVDGKAMLDQIIAREAQNPDAVPVATPVPTAPASGTGQIPPVQDFEDFKSTVRQYLIK